MRPQVGGGAGCGFGGRKALRERRLRGGDLLRGRGGHVAAQRFRFRDAGRQALIGFTRLGQYGGADVLGGAARLLFGLREAGVECAAGRVDLFELFTSLLGGFAGDGFGILDALADDLALAADFLDGAGHLGGCLPYAGFGVFDTGGEAENSAIKTGHHQRLATLAGVQAFGKALKGFGDATGVPRKAVGA